MTALVDMRSFDVAKTVAGHFWVGMDRKEDDCFSNHSEQRLFIECDTP